MCSEVVQEVVPLTEEYVLALLVRALEEGYHPLGLGVLKSEDFKKFRGGDLGFQVKVRNVEFISDSNVNLYVLGDEMLEGFSMEV